MSMTVKSINGHSINDDLRAIEQALDLLRPRVDVAHPALNGAIHAAVVELAAAQQYVEDRLAEALAAQR